MFLNRQRDVLLVVDDLKEEKDSVKKFEVQGFVGTNKTHCYYIGSHQLEMDKGKELSVLAVNHNFFCSSA